MFTYDVETTGMISNTLLDFMENSGKLPNEQDKGPTFQDKTVSNDCRERYTNLGAAWIGYKKAHGMIPHSWILESLELAKW